MNRANADCGFSIIWHHLNWLCLFVIDFRLRFCLCGGFHLALKLIAKQLVTYPQEGTLHGVGLIISVSEVIPCQKWTFLVFNISVEV